MSSLENIEELLLREFETIPFHNLFMLNNISKVPLELGGTCSDKVLHFKKVLENIGVVAKLHSAYINGFECHRMLTVEIKNQNYFIDVGSGWASPKLFPAFKPTEYSVYGMTFKTEIVDDSIILFHKTHKEFNSMVTIPLITKPEENILEDIRNRFADMSIYPFQKSLRFSKVKEKSFYFIKGNVLRIYNDEKQAERKLSELEIHKFINGFLEFDLSDLKYYFV